MGVLLPASYKNHVLEQTPEVQEEILKQLHAAYWDRGRLRFKCLPNAQTEMYDRVHQQPKKFPGVAEPLVMMCHRRLGKSHMAALLCVERCLSQPGAEVWFTTDTTEHARDFLEGKLIDTFSDMPPWISYRTRRNKYYFRNEKWPKHVESTLTIKGLDYQQGGSIRGAAADLFIIDEAREVKHLEFVVKRVITPMFKGRKDPTFVMLSTPAESMAHDFHRVYVERARMNDSLVVIPASKNKDWTPEDDKLMLKEYGSKDALGYQREIECMEIPDSSSLVVPEWTENKEKIRKTCSFEKIEAPPFYKGYVAADIGYKDHTGIVFARHDFFNNQIQVVGELFFNYNDTIEIIDKLVDKIEEVFPDDVVRSDLDITADTTALTLATLNRLLYEKGYYMREAETHDRDGSIYAMRASMKLGKILIQEDCVNLDKQLCQCTYNKSREGERKSIQRTEELGHADLVMALVYLHKTMKWHQNPVPPDLKTGAIGGKWYSPYANRNIAGPTYDYDTKKCLEGIFGRKIGERKR